MAGIGEAGDRKAVVPTGRATTPTKTEPAAATPAAATADAAAPPVKTARDGASVPDVTRGQAKATPVDLEQVDLEQEVATLMKDAEGEGVVGSAKQYWHEMRKQDGAAGYVGAAMETLLDFSGLPAVEHSAGELGARVGLGDSNKNIALAGGKLALDAGMAALNGVAGAGALASAGKAAKVATASKAVATTATAAGVVRHYTTAEKAVQIMKSGEIWASAKGMAGKDKVYLLAENAGERGMNFLRQMNIGVAKSGKAIEIDLAKLPPDVAARFRTEGFRGFLNQENFVTHAGKFDFKAFRGAVKEVDTEKLAITFDQVLKAGGSLSSAATTAVNTARGANGLANGA